MTILQLIMKAVNPRDVAYVFQKHVRSIHSKVARDDPNLLKLSIACAKVCAAFFIPTLRRRASTRYTLS